MQIPMPSFLSRSADLVGIVNTVLCLIHCLAMPLLVSVGAAFFAHPLLSWGFALLAFVAVYFATRNSTGRRVVWFLWGAASLFAMAVLLEHEWHWMHEVSYVASALLIIGHLLNLRGRVHAHSHA